MLGHVRLTFAVHRFEVVVVVAVAALAAAWLWQAGSQLLDVGVPDGCWPRDEEGAYALPVCEALMQRFWEVEGSTGLARAGLPFLAPVLGVVLGVPIVAREIELRTAELAWSLTLRRSRWLASRFLPMLALAIAVLAVIAMLGARYVSGLESGRSWPELTEIASAGAPLVARGLLAFGIALLAGAIVGRTMPALLVAAIAVVAWSLAVAPTMHGALGEQRALWQNESAWRTGEGEVIWYESGTFDPARAGQGSEPGQRLTERDAERLVASTCGDFPADGDAEEEQRVGRCYQELWELVQWSRVVPRSDFATLQVVDATVSLLIGGGAILLAFPIVARRRPS